MSMEPLPLGVFFWLMVREPDPHNIGGRFSCHTCGVVALHRASHAFMQFFRPTFGLS